MTKGAAPSGSDRNMGLLADVWESQEAEMARMSAQFVNVGIHYT